METIATRFVPASGTRGARIVAKCLSGSCSVAWNYALNDEANNVAAAQALLKKLNWTGEEWVGGAFNGGFIFVNPNTPTRVEA